MKQFWNVMRETFSDDDPAMPAGVWLEIKWMLVGADLAEAAGSQAGAEVKCPTRVMRQR